MQLDNETTQHATSWHLPTSKFQQIYGSRNLEKLSNSAMACASNVMLLEAHMYFIPFLLCSKKFFISQVKALKGPSAVCYLKFFKEKRRKKRESKRDVNKLRRWKRRTRHDDSSHVINHNTSTFIIPCFIEFI